MLSLVAFFIYLVLGVFVYRWSKLKYEELVGEKPREDDRFMISIFIFSITAICNMVYFGTLRFFY